MQGLIGKKIGMTRIFDSESGEVTPVTVVEVGSNIVQQVKTIENDGYSAVQMGFQPVAEHRVSKPKLGHFKKYASAPTRVVKEFNLDSEDEKLEAGQKIGVENFDGVDAVDVVGTIKGRGFAGTVKRWGFHIGRATHGNTNKRARGALSACSYPAKVFPGLKMAGQYGNSRMTIKGIKVVGVNKEDGLVYLKGGIPGKRTGIVYIKKVLS